MNNKQNNSDPKTLASLYNLPAHNGTYHLLAVLRSVEENKIPALLTNITDSSKKEYEILMSVEDLASQEMIALYGLRYGLFVLFLSSLYEENSGPEGEVQESHVEKIKEILRRGARNLSQMYHESAPEEGND